MTKLFFMPDCVFTITCQEGNRTQFFFSKVRNRKYVEDALIRKNIITKEDAYTIEHTFKSSHPDPISTLWTLTVADTQHTPAS